MPNPKGVGEDFLKICSCVLPKNHLMLNVWSCVVLAINPVVEWDYNTC